MKHLSRWPQPQLRDPMRLFLLLLLAGCDLSNTGQKGAEGCDTISCPVGTAQEEIRAIESYERDVSDGDSPGDGESGGRGVAFFSEGSCSFTCAALTECPAGTWPVITRDCFTCALLDEDGQVIESACDFEDGGSTGSGGSGSGSGSGADTGDLPPVRPGWEQVTVGDTHGCARYTDGSVTCWGDSDPPPDGVYTTVDAGAYGTCALTTGGLVVCWGLTGAGAGSSEEAALLAGVPTGRVRDISVGDDQACVLDGAGALTCWGAEETTLPGPFAAVSAGGAHVCTVSEGGLLACFGDDTRAQVRATPDGVYTAVSAGALHTCAIESDSAAAVCWTLDDDGESSPPSERWQSLSAGDRFGCGIDDEDALSCWGRGDAGQATPPDARAVSVSSGADHACAALWDGTVACWGANDRGQATGP